MKPYLYTTILILFFIQAKIFTQYEDTGKRGSYFSKKEYSGNQIPTFDANKEKLPSPILEDNKDYVDLYWKAWELAFKHYKKPPQGSPFVSNYIDEAFSPSVFQWDTIFMIMFARYAHFIFPAIQSLDNFYCRQYENGYMCREIQEADGKDYVYEGRENTVNPPLFSWAEVENYKITGDKSRYQSVLPVLEKYAEWLEKYRKKENTKHGLFWQTGLGSGMDNTPRSGSAWADMSCQVAMLYSDMAKMCDELKYSERAEKFRVKAKEISDKINQLMWNEDDGLYYDLDDDGNQIKCKTVGCFWAMLAGIASQHQAEKLLEHLKNPKEFWRPIPFPSLSYDHPDYKADGQYWLGGVWASTNVAIIKGLEFYGFEEFATLASQTYLDGIYKVYKKNGTIWENYSPESFSQGNPAKPDFVGWSGCGPIQLLIENVIGLRPEGAKNKLTWKLNRIDKHGIENLHFGEVTVSIICQRRSDVNSPAKISVTSNKPFELIVVNRNGTKNFNINPGKETINVE
ncbi:MAG: trehalase family glycosidase [Ignavibacteriales bacterium]|nr:trehalase family glycosidase [Ignavibacteriales bacterium]